MFIPAALQAVLLASALGAPPPGIRLIGLTTVGSQERDKSGLTGVLESGTPRDLLGGFGSGIAYAGTTHEYVVLPDRGPRDGKDSYHCRWHRVRIELKDAMPEFTLLSTQLMFEGEMPLMGLSAMIGPSSAGVRFDPEGVRVLPDGSVLVSDEYGPRIIRLDGRTGHIVREYAAPEAWRVAKPMADAKDETRLNGSGRVTNAGLEGLAVSPDGTRAFALMQGPLIQDGGKDGENLRMLEIDLGSGATRQLVYFVSEPGARTSEILAVNDHQFLTIERDGEEGPAAKNKRIMLIDTRGASDVSKFDGLPTRAAGLPGSIKPVKKRMFIDLLDLDERIERGTFPEKVEGLVFGPDLSTGEHTLIVTSDNDFLDDQPSWIWVIAIAPTALPGFEQQRFEAKAR